MNKNLNELNGFEVELVAGGCVYVDFEDMISMIETDLFGEEVKRVISKIRAFSKAKAEGIKTQCPSCI